MIPESLFPHQTSQLVVCGITGAFVAWLSWVVSSIVASPRPTIVHPFERKRREQLRRKSRLYRLAEPLIDEASRIAGRICPRLLIGLRRDLPLVSDDDIRAEEVLGRCVVAGMCCSVLLFVLTSFFNTFAGLVLSVFIFIVFVAAECRSITNAATQKRKRVRLRLPFAVDLIALMMEAGGGFHDSLQALVREDPDHPVGAEFGRVLRDIDLGRPREEALESFKIRMNDADVSELVFAISRGDELGTPLGEILRDQANQMQLKRAQWGEIAAADAEIRMVFPGMLVMVACLLVILATFLLPAKVLLNACYLNNLCCTGHALHS